jgi:uncharacterized protein (DUF1778 family)
MKRSVTLKSVVPRDEADRIRAAAKAENRSVSDFLKLAGLARAAEQLKEPTP